MAKPKELYYEKKGAQLVKALKKRNFDAWYCATKEQGLEKALELIPEGSVIGWGGAATAAQMGLLAAVSSEKYRAIDRDKCATAEEREQAMRDCLFSDVFITGANAISMDGEMVNIDGMGNRVAAIIYGPKTVLVVAGMNKVTDNLESAVERARTVAAPINQQRFLLKGNPCTVTGVCSDCTSTDCICNQIVITRNCRPAGRIKFILIGEELGF